MAKISGKLIKWRDYFGSAKSDIFDIIENAVMVAAIDHPKEFKLRRDRIAELLFSVKITRGLSCDKVEFVVPNADKVVANAVDVVGDKGTRKCNNEVVKETKSDVNVNKISDEEAEKLSDEIEEESRFVKEILRIKKILDNDQDKGLLKIDSLSPKVGVTVVYTLSFRDPTYGITLEQSDPYIYESLRKLQVMVLSVEILAATKIGKSVNALRKHKSKNIRNLVKRLVDSWRDMVNEWLNAGATVAEKTPKATKASVVGKEEEALPSPPLEDLPFLSNQATSIALSQVFDDLDEDGNALDSDQADQNHEHGRKAKNPVRRQQFTQNITAAPKDKKGDQQKKQTSLVKPNKPVGGNSGSGRGRLTRLTLQRKRNNDEMKLLQKSDKSKIQTTRPVPTQQNKLKHPDEDADHVKREATKRKLQERYQEAEKAKRQRMIQVMELRDNHRQDLPKQGPRDRNALMRPGNRNRPLANKRQ